MSGKWHGGKGDWFRKVDQSKYNENWENIFGKNKDINSVSNDEDTLDAQEENTETERETNP